MNRMGKLFEAYKGDAPYIFISYAHKDLSIVYPIIETLHERGYPIWYDEGIDPGNEWPDEIARALEKCSFFIVFISDHSANSKNVINEINFAIDENKRFLAIHIEDTKLPPGIRLRIGSTQAIMKYKLDDESFYKKVGKFFQDRICQETGPEDAYPQNTDPQNVDMTETVLTNVSDKLDNRLVNKPENETEKDRDLDEEGIELPFGIFSSGERGNVPGNLINGGRFAIKDNWIYFSNFDGKLYKMRSDGNERTKICDDSCENINVADDWIYYSSYSGMYRIRTNGTHRELLSNAACDFINVVDGWIYFGRVHSLLKKKQIHKMRTNGGSITKVGSDACNRINVSGDWIIYCKEPGTISRKVLNFLDDTVLFDGSSDYMTLYRIGADGRNKTVLSSRCLDFNAVDDWVYFTCMDGLNKVRLDGSYEMTLTHKSCMDFIVTAEWIYYVSGDSSDNGIYRIRTDGGQELKLNDIRGYYLHSIGDWIYFRDIKDNAWYRMRSDGSDKQPVF